MKWLYMYLHRFFKIRDGSLHQICYVTDMLSKILENKRYPGCIDIIHKKLFIKSYRI